ncbi:uncharacterized protein LOC143152348 isoform X1 [Ptiloglossa arizonensis]|uniref:uncharacterized protein LOC143152348 isoform X1 n=2 Tax=Ptiloglossa arizonensis TaxID=3350558 RepID=UPI003F9EF57A
MESGHAMGQVQNNSFRSLYQATSWRLNTAQLSEEILLTPCCAFLGVLFSGCGYRHIVVLTADVDCVRPRFTIRSRQYSQCTENRDVPERIGTTRSHLAQLFARNAFPCTSSCFFPCGIQRYSLGNCTEILSETKTTFLKDSLLKTSYLIFCVFFINSRTHRFLLPTVQQFHTFHAISSLGFSIER